MNFEQDFPLEAPSDATAPQTELPQWLKDNLEIQQPQNEGLPQWVLGNLEPAEQSERQLESTQTLGGVLREFFQKLSGDTEPPQERYELQEATDVWHVQEEPFSCANACQEFIIDEYLDTDVQESDLNALARENNWLRSDGTMLPDIGKLLEAYGIETHAHMNADYRDIKAALDDNNRVIVTVYNEALDEDWQGCFPVLTANHAVEVIGVDESDPDNIKVILNDPGVADGCGKVVSLETFNEARNGSGGYMLVAERP